MLPETRQALRAAGCCVLHSQVNSSGRMVHLIASQDGWDVAMFAQDVTDLVANRATIDEIIARNRGADLADPWPPISTLPVAIPGGTRSGDALIVQRGGITIVGVVLDDGDMQPFSPKPATLSQAVGIAIGIARETDGRILLLDDTGEVRQFADFGAATD